MRKRIPRIPNVVFLPAVVIFVAMASSSCGREKKPVAQLSAYGLNPEYSAYEVQCITTPPPPPPPGSSAYDPFSVPVPSGLPQVAVPIELASCNALAGQPPHFFNRSMPALTAVIDCVSKVVRFRTHDWQVGESSGIGPAGDIDASVMLIDRLVNDAAGNENCWARLLGHVTGKASCPGTDPLAGRVDFKVEWRFDETPPEIMEPPLPGHADLRNGKHCKFLPGNCSFSNTASVGCGG